MDYDYGRFVWFELLTTEVDKAQAFYGEVAGWKSTTMEMPGGMKYPMILQGETPIGGFVPPPRPDVPPHWVSYVSVEDVNATAKRIDELGGKALMDAFDAPGVGRMQPVADPQGAAVFLFHAADGDKPAAEGAGAFHWNELATSDVDAAVAFYTKIFGYTAEPMEMPNGTYVVLKDGETPRGGVMAAPDGSGDPHWQQYIAVDDCDAAVGRAERNGGKVVMPAIDVEGVGRFAHVADTVGGVIGLIKPAQ